MSHFFETLSVTTNRHCDMLDITSLVQSAVANSGIDAGTVTIHCPHTTAGITINENADPDVIHDILMTLEALIPQNRPGYRHCEGNSDAHVKSSLVGASEVISVQHGKMILGTWQGIYFCEFDGPRKRTVRVHISS